MKLLKTPADVFAQFDDLEAVRELTARKDIRVVCNWKQRGFPPDTFLVVTMELEKRGFKVDPAVFGMARPRRVREDA